MVEPTTVAELNRAIGGVPGEGYGMFWPMTGFPQAFMEIPTRLNNGSLYFARFGYTVVMSGSQESGAIGEQLAVRDMYQFLKARRHDVLQLHGQEDIPDARGKYPVPPVLFVRRPLELTRNDGGLGTRLTYRICIPGIDLEQYDMYSAGQITTAA